MYGGGQERGTTNKRGGASVMAWACISADCVVDLYIYIFTPYTHFREPKRATGLKVV